MLPQVSILIPTYNHSQYVLETLDSVFAQTYLDYEIIVINDGSPDDTRQVLQPLVRENRIQYIEQENQGQAAARNRGLALARGKFIAFLDDDDLWPPDKLGWQVAFLQSHPDVAFVSGEVQDIDEKGQAIGSQINLPKTANFETLFNGNPFISPGQILIRTARLREIGGLNENLWGTDDYDLWFRLAKRGKIAVRPQLSLYYRRHSGNASNNTFKMFVNCIKTVEIQLEQVPSSKRAWLSRGIYRCLYMNVTRNAILDLRIHKLRAIPAALQAMPQFFLLARPMLCDRVLMKYLIEDCLPNALKPLWRLMKKRVRF